MIQVFKLSLNLLPTHLLPWRSLADKLRTVSPGKPWPERVCNAYSTLNLYLCWGSRWAIYCNSAISAYIGSAWNLTMFQIVGSWAQGMSGLCRCREPSGHMQTTLTLFCFYFVIKRLTETSVLREIAMWRHEDKRRYHGKISLLPTHGPKPMQTRTICAAWDWTLGSDDWCMQNTLTYINGVGFQHLLFVSTPQLRQSAMLNLSMQVQMQINAPEKQKGRATPHALSWTEHAPRASWSHTLSSTSTLEPVQLSS